MHNGDTQDFGWALAALKRGERVSGSGWNGKEMWLAYVRAGWSADHNVAAIVPESTLPFIIMYTADKKFVPWLASQTDVLSDDWGSVSKG